MTKIAVRPEASAGKRPVGRPRKQNARGSQYDKVSVFLPPALVRALDAATEAEGLDSRSEVIRQACRSYLKRAEKRLGRPLPKTA
jgi:hypothetical protein